MKKGQIPGTFSYTSWGSGSCPADRSVNYHYGTLNLTFQPACDAAVMANPVIIAIAGLAAAGVGIISYAAVSTAFDAVLSLAQSHYNNIGVDMLSLMGLGGIGEAMGIIVGAMTFKITMTTVKRLGLKQS